MSVSSRLQCAVIAVAVLPCLATAQPGVLGSSRADAQGAAYQTSAAPAEIAVNSAQRNAATGEATAIPAPNVETDPIPTVADQAPTSSAPVDAQMAATTGPSLTSATAGFQTQTTHLTRQQMADRAMDQDGGRRGIGRDAVLMIIGGAAIVAGAIVGGGAGVALIVVGAVIGATGLVLILS